MRRMVRRSWLVPILPKSNRRQEASEKKRAAARHTCHCLTHNNSISVAASTSLTGSIPWLVNTQPCTLKKSSAAFVSNETLDVAFELLCDDRRTFSFLCCLMHFCLRNICSAIRQLNYPSRQNRRCCQDLSPCGALLPAS